MRLYMSPRGILSEIYAKPTDDHTYLSPNSNHPHYQYKGIVIGVAMRVRSITDDEFLDKHAESQSIPHQKRVMIYLNEASIL